MVRALECWRQVRELARQLGDAAWENRANGEPGMIVFLRGNTGEANRGHQHEGAHPRLMRVSLRCRCTVSGTNIRTQCPRDLLANLRTAVSLESTRPPRGTTEHSANPTVIHERPLVRHGPRGQSQRRNPPSLLVGPL